MFPPVEEADEDGLLCYGGDLAVETLIEAYSKGIFPWPHEGCPLLWFAPPQRGILFVDEFYLSRRAMRELRKSRFEFRIDSDFAGVMRGCAGCREYSLGTWVNDEIIDAYGRLHQLGIAHSVETYLDNKLVGGLYGVSWGNYFCGESMFHRVENASKAALAFLVEHCQSRGAGWIDCQLQNPFFERLGAREIPRDEFLIMLDTAMNRQDAKNAKNRGEKEKGNHSSLFP